MIKIAMITSEISHDFDHALQVMSELGMEHVEIETLWGKHVGQLTDDEIKKLKGIVKKWDMKVCCLSPQLFFRVPLRAGPDQGSYWGSYSEHLDRLETTMRVGREFDVNLIKTFGFANEIWYHEAFFGDIWGMLQEKFEEPLRMVEREGFVLAIETCFLNNVSSASMARTFMEKMGSEHMRVLWDPGNTLFVHEIPYPDGYELIKDYIAHIHIKDGVVDVPNCSFELCAPGHGQVKTYPDILKRLMDDNYQGVISLEPEYAPPDGTMEDGATEAHAALMEMMGNL